jgi:ubiquinone/menaquinone biosynthesis C-methylase UbiE
MPRKGKKPTVNAYFGDRAEDYSTQAWMARNQQKTSRRAIELLFDPKLGTMQVPLDKSALMLDAACGSGYSSEVLQQEELPFVGADISMDMLGYAAAKGFAVVNADLRCLPFRPAVFSHGISISGLNFVTDGAQSLPEVGERYFEAAAEFARVVQAGSRFAIEFYPSSQEELDQSLAAFKQAGFRGFLVVDNPGRRKEQKYLVIEKE